MTIFQVRPEQPSEADKLRQAMQSGAVSDSGAEARLRELVAEEERRAHVEALLRERAGYERSGKSERVDEVDAELKRLGHKAKASA